MVTVFTEHTRSINMENPKTIDSPSCNSYYCRCSNMEGTTKEILKQYHHPVVIVSICTEHNRSRNMKVTFKGNPITKASPDKMDPICTDHIRSRKRKLLLKEILKL